MFRGCKREKVIVDQVKTTESISSQYYEDDIQNSMIPNADI